MSLLLSVIAISSLSLLPLQNKKKQHNAHQLHKIARHLVSYARTYHLRTSRSNNPFTGLYGFLPCGDGSNNQGDGRSYCTGANTNWSVTRIPWYSIGMQPLFDAQGECYWYIVPNNARTNLATANTLHNADVIERIHYRGNTGIAAVVATNASNLKRKQRGDNTPCRADHTVGSFLPNLVIPADNQQPLELSTSSYSVHLIKSRELFKDVYTLHSFTQLRDELGEALVLCLGAFANAQSSTNSNGLPLPAKISTIKRLPSNSAYRSSSGHQLGRFPFRAQDNTRINAHCDNITLSNGSRIDISDSNSKTVKAHRRLWVQWKDHWWLESYPQCGLGGNCLEIDGIQYVARVHFGGRRLESQIRPSISVEDYLEANLSNDQHFCLNTLWQFANC